MRIITIEGVTVICKGCNNKAMDELEYCCICASIEGLI